jgi:hypothetical protein
VATTSSTTGFERTIREIEESKGLVSNKVEDRSYGSLSVAFGLAGAVVAFGIMRAADTAWLDPFAFHAGVGAAAVLGSFAAFLVQRLRHRPFWENKRWAFVPLAGAAVGSIVQAVLLRVPVTYTGQTVGLTKAEPVSWVLAGAPMGAIPAVALTFLLHAATRHTSTRSLDARERMIVPVAGTCLVLAAAASVHASRLELPGAIIVILFGLFTLFEVIFRDRQRAEWLKKAFRGDGPFFVIPSSELAAPNLPALLSGTPATATIVRQEEGSYRMMTRVPIATTADHETPALAPLVQRRRTALTFVGVSIAAFLLSSFAASGLFEAASTVVQ